MRNIFTIEREQGKIPSDTCPLIDSIIDKGLTEDQKQIIEEVREANAKLRELGKYWHRYYEELLSEHEDLERSYKKLEKSYDELDDEIRELLRHECDN